MNFRTLYIYIYIEREREREILLSTEYISSIPLEIVYLSMILSKGLKIPSLHVNTNNQSYYQKKQRNQSGILFVLQKTKMAFLRIIIQRVNCFASLAIT